MAFVFIRPVYFHHYPWQHLMERRPILLSSVLLRQNPHNVAEWHKRVKLYKDANDARNVIQVSAYASGGVDVVKMPN